MGSGSTRLADREEALETVALTKKKRLLTASWRREGREAGIWEPQGSISQALAPHKTYIHIIQAYGIC